MTNCWIARTNIPLMICIWKTSLPLPIHDQELNVLSSRFPDADLEVALLSLSPQEDASSIKSTTLRAGCALQSPGHLQDPSPMTVLPCGLSCPRVRVYMRMYVRISRVSRRVRIVVEEAWRGGVYDVCSVALSQDLKCSQPVRTSFRI